MRASIVLLGFIAAACVDARDAYQEEIPNGAHVVRNGVAWPGVGHMTAAGGGARNTFGAAFAAAGNTWTSALCQADTDGDGFSNGAELGDPGCVWTKGATPERTVDIAHPGFADSQPAISAPSFRLVGPSAHEGVLQARIYPRPWGAVNFGSGRTTPGWARDYCRKAFQLDSARLARAWAMTDRPHADKQYLPAGEYVSISDPKGCTKEDITSCAFTYSDVGSPQNTTRAYTDTIYVDCRYNDPSGKQPAYLPVRLVGPDEGRGTLQALVKDINGQSEWVLAKPNVAAPAPAMAPERFVCERLLGYNPGVFSPVLTPRTSDSLDYAIALPPCGTGTPLVDCAIDYVPVLDKNDGDYVSQFVDCVGTPAPIAGKRFTGPSRLELVAAINDGTDQATFAALVASTYTGVAADDVKFRYWTAKPEFKLIYVAFHVTASSATVNPSDVLKKIASDDSGTFGVVASRFELVPDDSGQPTGIPKFRLLGPASGTKGLLQARYQDSDPWGLVNWKSSATWAKVFCGLAGVSADGFIPLFAAQSTVPEAATHVPADGFMSLTDPGVCGDEGNVTSCNWLWSTKTALRNASNATNAMWLDCQWSSYPETRLVWSQPCMGNLEVKMPGKKDWEPAWTDLPIADVCKITGCSCDDPPPGETTTKCGHLKQQQYDASYFLHTCDLNDRSTCSITTHNPPQQYASNAFQCWWRPYWSPTTKEGGHWISGQTVRFVYVVLNGTWQTEQHIRQCVGDFHGIPHDWVVIDTFDKRPADETTHMQLRFVPEYLQKTLLRRIGYTGLLDCMGSLSSQAEIVSKLQIRPATPRYPNPPELKLAGPHPWEGFVMARFDANSEWGKITSESGYHANTWPMGDLLCKSVGQYRMDKVSRVYRSKEAWMTRPGAAAEYQHPWDYISLFNLVCQDGQDRHLHECLYEYNTLVQNATISDRFYGADESFYVNCQQEPYEYRLVGPFPGTGFLQLRDELGNWTEVDVEEIAPGDACAKLATYPTERGFTPYHTVVNERTWYDVSALACTDPLLPGWKCPLRMMPIRKEMRHDLFCTKPPATIPGGGASITLMNAAVEFTPGLTSEMFQQRAAAVIGVKPEQIIIRQWTPNAKKQMAHVTAGINATGMNIAVKLNEIAADATVGVLRSDVRAFPIPANVQPHEWQWALETAIGAGPGATRGTIVARPTVAFPFGVPCAQKWTLQLTKAFCGAVFGPALLQSSPRDPFWQVQPLEGDAVRTLYLEEVRCGANSPSILNCSYAYAAVPSSECPGDANVFVDCMPTTMTRSASLRPPMVVHSRTASLPASTPAPPPTTSGAPNTTAAPTSTAASTLPSTHTGLSNATMRPQTTSVVTPPPGTATVPPTTTGLTPATSGPTSTAGPSTPQPPPPPPMPAGHTRTTTRSVTLAAPVPRATSNVSLTLVMAPPVPQAAPLADEVAIDKEPAGAAAATGTAAAGTALAMLSGPADMSDLQVLAMASELSCSQVVAKVAPQAEGTSQEEGGDGAAANAKSEARSSVLTPLTSVGLDVWALDLRALIGSFLLVVVFAVVHRIGVAVFGLVTRRSAQEAAPLLYYPNVPLAIFLALSQGMIVAALRLVLRPEMMITDRAFGLIATIVMLTVAAFVGKRRIAPEHIVGKRVVRGRFLLHERWDGSGPAAGLGAYFTCPVGFWSPAFTQKSFGACFSQLRPASATFTADRPPGSAMEIPLLPAKSASKESNAEAASNDMRQRAGAIHVLRPLLFGLCAAIPFDALDSCDAQYGLTCLAALIMAVMVAVLKPYRWAPANWLLAIASTTLALVCGLSLSVVPKGLRDAVRLDVIIMIAAMLLLVGKIAAVVTMVRERGWKRERLEQYEKAHGLGGVPTADATNNSINGPAPAALAGVTVLSAAEAPLLNIPLPMNAHAVPNNSGSGSTHPLVKSSDAGGSRSSGSANHDGPQPVVPIAANPLSERERHDL